MGRNIISSHLNLEDNNFIEKQLIAIQKSLPQVELVYILNAEGQQIGNMLTKKGKLYDAQKVGTSRSDRAYYYRTVQEHRCVLTDPYPSLGSNEMVVTSSFPIYDEENNLLFIICVDIELKDILKMVHPSSVDSNFGIYAKFVYSCFSLALLLVSLLLFVKGISGFLHLGLDINSININEMFKATILLTLALAIFDLVKAIFEEEVLGKEKKDGAGDGHQTMIRFLGSIIIALSIEALMLVFKFAITEPEKLSSAVQLIYGVTVLMIGLSIYIYVNKTEKK
jgi:hypothetical protein